MTFTKSSTLLLLIFVLFFSSCLTEAVRKPVIGILSTPSDFRDIYNPQDFSYIKGAYAEFIEAADATPVGIPWDLPERDLVAILDSINGILFTGGDSTLWEYDPETNENVFTAFTKRTAFIVQYAIYLNDKGIHFPVYGICQGHEVIVMGIAGKPNIIDFFKHPSQFDIVEITDEGKNSRMFNNMPGHLAEFIKDRRSMFYNHRFGFNMSLTEENNLINNFFKVTARGIDDKGKEFIAAMEANEYPIYTVQYHPERVLSEWKNKDHFNHPDEAAHAVIAQAKFFIAEARKNQQMFVTDKHLERFLIDNHEKVHFNVTWPRVHFYHKKTPISYHIDSDLSECEDIVAYECVNDECTTFDRDL